MWTTVLLFFSFISSQALAQYFNNRAVIQGYLKQGSTALNDVTGYPMRFLVKRNTTIVWCQTSAATVPVVNGIFNVILSGNSNCQSLTNAFDGSVFAHSANSDAFLIDVVVDVNKDGFGGADDATFSGIDIVSSPLAIMSNYANFALSATNATNATTATTATTAGNVSGVVALANGGTGATSAAAARTALGLGSIATINTSGVSTDYLKGDGTWGPVPSAGTVTSILAGTGLTGGPITTSGTLAVDVGITANKIVQLTAAAKLPAVDGSLLTNINAVTSVTAGAGLTGGAITSTGTLAVDSSTAGASNKILQMDGTGVANMFGAGIKGATSGAVTLQAAGVTTNYSLTFPSAQGSANQVLSNNGAGVLSWVNPMTVVDSSYSAKGIVQFNTDAATSGMTVSAGLASVNAGTAANQIVKLDGTAKLPAVDASVVTGLNASNISSGTLALTRGGTGAAITAANGGMLYSTASALALLAPGTSGQVLSSGGAGAPSWTTPVSLAGTNTWSGANTFSAAITAPSVTGATTLGLNSTGANNITLTPGTGNVVIASGQLMMPAAGVITSSSGALTYTAAAAATFQAASGSTTTLGQSAGASPTTIQAGASGALSIGDNGSGAITIGNSTSSGTISLGNTSSGAITVGSASTAASTFGNTGAAALTTLRSGTGGLTAAVTGTTGNITITPGTTSGTVTIGNASTGATVIGNTGAGSATTIQSGTGKIKIGSAGAAFTSMGYCTVSSATYTANTPATGTCTGIVGTTTSVFCSPSVAIAGGSAARATAANTVAFTSTATITGSLYCMFMNP